MCRYTKKKKGWLEVVRKTARTGQRGGTVVVTRPPLSIPPPKDPTGNHGAGGEKDRPGNHWEKGGKNIFLVEKGGDTPQRKERSASKPKKSPTKRLGARSPCTKSCRACMLKNVDVDNMGRKRQKGCRRRDIHTTFARTESHPAPKGHPLKLVAEVKTLKKEGRRKTKPSI